MFESLDFLYVPTEDVDAGARRYVEQFGAELVWKVRAIGAVVACLHVSDAKAWWRDFLRDPRGTGFWHELYSVRGGMEGVYDDMPGPLGFGKFAPRQPARGRMFGACGRLAREDAAPAPVRAELRARIVPGRGLRLALAGRPRARRIVARLCGSQTTSSVLSGSRSHPGTTPSPSREKRASRSRVDPRPLRTSSDRPG